MTFPIDITIGSIVIPSHFLFDILALYVAFKMFGFYHEKYNDPLPEEHRWFVLLGGLAGAIIGSRLLAALEHPSLFLHPPIFLYYYANKTILGGLIGGILGVELVKKILKQRNRSGDLFVYPLIAGIIVGRIGCFLTGVKDGTVGKPSSLPWAFNQGDGIPRHPTALYEIIFLILFWVAAQFIEKKVVLQNGVLFRLFIISYCAFRFGIEFIKPIEPLAFGLSAIQIASLLFALFYAWTLIPRKDRPHEQAQLQ